uniref:DNA-directed RNA polymerase n=1 Tax=Dermatophagoides pteronyssinus TaxID=6956 RepID=A0A6P6Y7B9_DERPT
QWLEKKSGVIRQKMMGKRVNYAARTIIAPDCMLDTNEVGVPAEFARKLTIPMPVNQYNLARAEQLVRNGAERYPGCAGYQDLQGRRVDFSQVARFAQGLSSKNHVLFRHVVDGDVVLMNRQPSLHRPSILAHYVRVLGSERAFRLHYANCSSYNADFDGDEMNLHCLQDCLAQSEARELLNADCHYAVPKNGEPLRGLIQDHVVAGNLLTVRDTF